jgi:DNA mismatch endonuclease (patch repair protein)
VHSSWNDQVPSETAWRAEKDMSRAARTSEQDMAAGGSVAREIRLPDGRVAHASVALRLYRRTRRVRAYLRWSDRGLTKERYLGEVGYATRAENLRAAWHLVHKKEEVTTVPLEPGDNQSTRKESWASSKAVRAVMRANHGRDTKPEKLLRSRLFAMGLRYRVGHRPLPKLRRTADLVFVKNRVAVFVDGCFWHGCPEHHRPARQNADFWRVKIEGNKKRDEETNQLLVEAGWRVVRIWEHEAIDEAVQRVLNAVRA